MKEKVKSKSFFKGALILMLFGLLSKLIGAIYRIPLTGIIGAEGMGLYQMVFPLYTLMLTISSSGIPSSISKLISENIAKKNYKQADKILKMSFLLLVCFSFICTLFVVVGSNSIAGLQGNKSASICYLGLAPAIIFVGLISGFRGYFQGLENMTPSAVSGFIEQLVKMLLGLYLASVFIDKGVEFAVFGAMIGISISEFIAFIYLLIRYAFGNRKRKELMKENIGCVLDGKKTIKSILSLSVIVTLSGLIMPLSMLIDSVVVINILKKIGYSVSLSTKLFGLQTGTVGSIVNMPVVLSLGVATSILPCVSSHKAKGDMVAVKESASKAMLLTIMLALPASVGCFTFAEQIIRLLYSSSLSAVEISIASKILEVASFGIFYLALVQVSSGLLQGLAKFKTPLIALGCGAVVKIILNLVLIRIKGVNIIGAEVSTVVCYMVAFFINFAVLKKQGLIQLDCKVLFILGLSLMIYPFKYFYKWLFGYVNFYVALFSTVLIVVFIYFFWIFILFFKRKKTK